MLHMLVFTALAAPEAYNTSQMFNAPIPSVRPATRYAGSPTPALPPPDAQLLYPSQQSLGWHICTYYLHVSSLITTDPGDVPFRTITIPFQVLMNPNIPIQIMLDHVENIPQHNSYPVSVFADLISTS